MERSAQQVPTRRDGGLHLIRRAQSQARDVKVNLRMLL